MSLSVQHFFSNPLKVTIKEPHNFHIISQKMNQFAQQQESVVQNPLKPFQMIIRFTPKSKQDNTEMKINKKLPLN